MTFSRLVLMVILTIGLLAAPRAAGAQQAARVPRIGWLGGPTRESAEPFVRAFQQGLKDLGWVEGQNIVIEWRFAGGRAERLPDLASDPVGLGLVASLARPGGNITGSTSNVGPEIAGKRLELLKETVPKVSRMAVLWNPTTPGNALALREAEIAARGLGLELQLLEARSLDDFDSAFAAMTTRRAGALLVLRDVMFVTHRIRLADLTAKSRLPRCTRRESPPTCRSSSPPSSSW